MAINHEEIKIQAKQILDKFADALKSVDKEIKEDSYIDREEFERVEGESISKSKDSEASINADKSVKTFKQKILENAPEHDDNFIFVEKGKYKKEIVRICDKYKIPSDSSLRNYFVLFEYHANKDEADKDIEVAKKFLETVCIGEKLEKAISCLEDIKRIRK